MRLTHRRAGWALAAAGSFGLTLSGLAQQPGLPVAKALPPVPVAVAGDVAPSEARLVEIKVELAWLGDTATFPCQLAARKVGNAVEIGGFVPTEALRLKALEVARKHCTLPVVDKLVIHPGSALPMMTSPHEHLCQSAAEVLTKALADHGETFSFSADATGEVTVSGTLKNWEEKLNVSRRLSMIPGCTAIVNNFDVKDVLQAGKHVEYISADGKLCVPAGTAVAAAPKPQPTVVLAAPKPQPAPVAVAAAPKVLPAPVAVNTPPKMLPAPVVSNTPPAPVATAPAKSGLLASLVNRNTPPATLAAPVTRTPNLPPAGTTVTTRTPVTVAPPVVTVAAVKPPVAVAPATPYGGPIAAAAVKPPVAAAPVKPAPQVTPYGGPVAAANVKPVVMAAPARPIAAPRPTGAQASPYGGSATIAAAPKAPAPKPPSGGIQQVAYQAPQNQPSGVVQASYVPAPAAPKASPYGGTARPAQAVKPAAPAVVAQAPRSAPAALPGNLAQAPVLKPTTATPAIRPVAAVTALPTAQPAAGMSPVLQGQLLQKIHDLGGVAVQDARIHCTSKNACVIQVVVRSRAEAQEIGQKVLKMPELVPYKVDLKVEVAQPNPVR